MVVDISTFFDFMGLVYMHKFGNEQYERLKKEWNDQQSNIAIGRLATSGTRLFKITKLLEITCTTSVHFMLRRKRHGENKGDSRIKVSSLRKSHFFKMKEN